MFKKHQNTSEPIPIEVTQSKTIKIDSDSLPDYVKVGELTTASIISKSCGQCMACFYILLLCLTIYLMDKFYVLTVIVCSYSM